MLQFQFYLFAATRQHLIPKPVSPKWARIYNTQSTHRRLNEYSGAYTDENFVSLFLNFVSLFLNGMHATSQLRITETYLWTPQKSIGKSGRFRSSGSTFWFRSTRLRFGHFLTRWYLKKLLMFMKFWILAWTCDICRYKHWNTKSVLARYINDGAYPTHSWFMKILILA